MSTLTLYYIERENGNIVGGEPTPERAESFARYNRSTYGTLYIREAGYSERRKVEAKKQ